MSQENEKLLNLTGKRGEKKVIVCFLCNFNKNNAVKLQESLLLHYNELKLYSYHVLE